MTKVSARGRRQKGAKAERAVRDELKKIYEVDRHTQIHRVPMSGAGFMKGDVVDLNDTSWCYEVKCQETLQLHAWWRQTKSQANSYQTPCLVFTSNHRPLYWVMKVGDWEAYEGSSVFDGVVEYVVMSTRGIYTKLAMLSQVQVGHTTLDSDDVVIVPNELYIALRKDLYKRKTQ